MLRFLENHGPKSSFSCRVVGAALAEYIDIDGHNLSCKCGWFIFAQPSYRRAKRAFAFSLGRMLSKCIDYGSKCSAVLIWNIIDLETEQVWSSIP